MRKLSIAALLIFLMGISCKSTGDEHYFESSNLPGMIYDADNRPCDKVTIEAYSLDESGEESYLLSVSSDIHGRFTLPDLERNTYRIYASREGYESISTEVYYSSRLDVLYLKIYSQKQILNIATDLLEQKRYGNVEAMLERSESVNSADPYHLYIKAVFFFEKEQYGKALEALQAIVDQNFRFPFVHLLMADIYQYKTGEVKKALSHLNIYKDLYNDGQADQRIKELEKYEID